MKKNLLYIQYSIVLWIIALGPCFIIPVGAQDIRTSDEVMLDLKNAEDVSDELVLILELTRAYRYERKDNAYDSTIAETAKRVLFAEEVSDTLKAKVLIEYGWSLKAQAMFDSALVILNRAEAFAGDNKSLLSDVFHNRASTYYNSAQYDSAVASNLKALALREALDDLDGQAVSLNNLSLVYMVMREYANSIESAEKSLAIREALGHQQLMADVLGNLGGNYSDLGQYDKAMAYLIRAIDINTELEMPIGRSSAIWANLGVVYTRMSDYTKATAAFEKVLEIQAEVGNKYHIAFALEGLAVVFEEQGHFNEALKYQRKGLAIATQLQDDFAIARRLQNLGVAFEKLNMFDSAEYYHLRSLEMRIAMEDHKGLSNNYWNLGHLYLRQQMPKKGLSYYEQSLEEATIADQIIEQSQAYEGLYLAHKALGNYQQSLESFEQYKLLSDSMLNEEKIESIANLEIKYETEKKEQHIALLNADNEIQAAQLSQSELELQRNQILIALLVVVIVLIIFLYRRQLLKHKLRAEEEKAALKGAQIKAVIQSQEEERKRFAMDLHDDFGQLISALRIQTNVVGLSDTVKEKVNGQLDQMYASLKGIAFNLMPQTLVDKGLNEAVAELCLQLNRLGDIEFQHLSYDITDRLGDTEKVAAYRIIQEVINNIIKYAHATKVTINMTGLGDKLSIMIEDNGDGFDVNNLKKGLGNGWRNIQSRLDLLAGEIDFDSVEGRKNSTVSLEIPYYLGQQAA